MNIKPHIRIYLLQIIPFGLIWLAAGIIYLLLEKSLLGDLGYYPMTGNPHDFWTIFPLVFIGSFSFGIVIGAIEVFFLSKRFIKGSFGSKFIVKSLIYVLFMIIVLLTLSTIGNILLSGFSIFHVELWQSMWRFFTSMPFWTMEIYIAAMIIVSLFFYEVSGNMGNEVLLNFLSGKYHSPLTEDRIFLFVDMKSSTAIAEKLGHVQYFEMLRDYYAVISPPILRHGGEVYQYVGDEIVITWRIRNENQAAFLHCLVEMKNALSDQSDRFLSTYDVVPTFKAGVHGGTVTTGEIGVIKHEIIFTGDVLNTAARIQGLCNGFGVEMLISEDVIAKIINDPLIEAKSIGFHELRGREKGIELFTATINTK